MFRERTVLVAVIIQVIVAAFSGFLVTGLASLVDPGAATGHTIPTHVGLVAEFPDNATRDADGAWAPIDRLNKLLTGQKATPVAVETEALARRGLELGTFDAVVRVVIPANATDALRIVAIFPDGELRTTYAFGALKRALESYEEELRLQGRDRLQVEPLYLDGPRSGGSHGFVYGLLIPLLVLLPIVLSGALTADSVTEELARGTLPLLLTTPARTTDVFAAKLLANCTLAPVLTAAWLGLLALNNLTVTLGAAALITAAAAGASILLGLLACVIALVTRDRNKAHIFYALTAATLMGASLLLPVSPVNAVARVAAGSPTTGAQAVLVATIALAGVAYVAFHAFAGRRLRLLPK